MPSVEERRAAEQADEADKRRLAVGSGACSLSAVLGGTPKVVVGSNDPARRDWNWERVVQLEE
jgi:hypothetical protein